MKGKSSDQKIPPEREGTYEEMKDVKPSFSTWTRL